MTKGRYRTTAEPSIGEIIADLKRRVALLESGARAGYTSVDKGTLNIKTGSMNIGATATFSDQEAPSVAFYRTDGRIAFSLDGSDGSQSVAIYDGAGNVVMGDDKIAEQGLLRPWIPINWELHSSFAPDVTTTSGSFTPLMTGRLYKQHPRVFVEVLVLCSDGTTAGEVKLMVAATTMQIGTTIVVPAGYYGLVNLGPAPILSDHLTSVELEIQVRRTAGAGSVGIRVMSSYGVES